MVNQPKMKTILTRSSQKRISTVVKLLLLVTVVWSILLASWVFTNQVVIYPETALLLKPRGRLPPVTSCIPGVPCEYEDEVDLRIIVMTYNRYKSLQLCLDKLQDIILDGDNAVLEIWVDRDKTNGTIHDQTLNTALYFKWAHGPVRVTVQESHVGIYGQWIDTWRPRVKTREIAIFLEDDIDVSPYAYRWTKAAHAKYDHRPDVCGYSLSEIDIVDDVDAPFQRPRNYSAFMFRRYGTFGFSPHPKVWREFQDWFHYKQKYNPEFHPYVAEDNVYTLWYQIFEKRKTQSGMWSMWFEYYTYYHGAFAVFPNIGSYLNQTGSLNATNTTLAFHRREKGLHFHKKAFRTNSLHFLLNVWKEEYILFPDDIPKYNYTGMLIKAGDILVSPLNMTRGDNMENHVTKAPRRLQATGNQPGQPGPPQSPGNKPRVRKKVVLVKRRISKVKS